MYGLLLFLHLTGLAVWLGSLLMVAVMLFMLKRAPDASSGDWGKRVIRAFNLLTHPSAFVVLVSGIFMLVQLDLPADGKAFWLSYMEKAGGMIVVLSIVFLTLMGRRVVRRTAEGRSLFAARGMNLYVAGIVGTIAVLLTVVYAAASKLTF